MKTAGFHSAGHAYIHIYIYSVSNQLSAWLYASLPESRLEQDIHKLFIPSDRQFNTLGVHNLPAFKAVAFVSSIQPKAVM